MCARTSSGNHRFGGRCVDGLPLQEAFMRELKVLCVSLDTTVFCIRFAALQEAGYTVAAA